MQLLAMLYTMNKKYIYIKNTFFGCLNTMRIDSLQPREGWLYYLRTQTQPAHVLTSAYTPLHLSRTFCHNQITSHVPKNNLEAIDKKNWHLKVKKKRLLSAQKELINRHTKRKSCVLKLNRKQFESNKTKRVLGGMN